MSGNARAKEIHPIRASLPNPLRVVAAARALAGLWFIASGASTLRQYRDLLPAAERLLARDIGATDAPIRALVMLMTAPILIGLGVVLIVGGLRWMGRVPLPAGPAAISPDDVIATLHGRHPSAYTDEPTRPCWPLRRWLSDELVDLTWWRRDMMSRAVRALIRCCVLTLVVTATWLLISFAMTDDVLGPFPSGFVVAFPFLAVVWAGLALMLIASSGPRIESVEFPMPPRPRYRPELPAGLVIETPPHLLHLEPPAVGVTLGVSGVAGQCLLLAWWSLPFTGYPLLATSIVRDTASIAGGALFFLAGDRMVASAAELLRQARYESLVIMVENSGSGAVCRAAAIRSESRGLRGPRYIVAATGGIEVRELAEELVLHHDPTRVATGGVVG